MENFENKDSRKEYRKVYYSDNKSKILSRMAEMVKCQHCDKTVSRQHLNRHMKTKYCKLVVQQPNPTNELDQLRNRLIELENKFNQLNN